MDQLLMEKCAENFREDNSEPRKEKPDYDVKHRMWAIEDLLSSFEELRRQVESYKSGNPEEKRYYEECGRMRTAINLYIDVLQDDYNAAWKDYCEMEED